LSRSNLIPDPQEGLSVSQSADLPARRSRGVTFLFNGTEVLTGENRLVDLTQMWTGIGAPPDKEPSEWARDPSTVDYIRGLAVSLDVGIDQVWEPLAGQGAERTLGHWQIAMAYSESLSPEVSACINEAFLKWALEEDDPDLLLQEAIDDYRRQGKDAPWILARLEGILRGDQVADTLTDHGVEGERSAICFDATRNELLAGPDGETILRPGLSDVKTRDDLDELEQKSLDFADEMAEARICDRYAKGNEERARMCREVGAAIHRALAAAAE
jgi:hypothetical protein